MFALIGAVGTPTAMATIPITSARNVPFIGPFTGAEFLRDLELANVVNIRASYGAEAEAWVKHLTEDLPLHPHRASSTRTISSAATASPA